MKTKQILKDLVNIPAISKFENLSELPNKIKDILQLKESKIDQFGNVIAKISSGKKKILVEAHLDEVGFEKNGEKFLPLGHLDSSLAKSESISTKDNKIFYFNRYFKEKGNLIESPALDNKVGCTALILAAEYLKECNAEIYTAFTVQEETTGQGIKMVVDQIKPDIIISIDSAYAQPINKPGRTIPICGNGPAIQTRGKGFTIENVEEIENIAKENNIPYQFEIVNPNEGGTNLSSLKNYKAKKIQINIPVRYQHTPSSETDLRDIENTALLVSALIKYLSK